MSGGAPPEAARATRCRGLALAPVASLRHLRLRARKCAVYKHIEPGESATRTPRARTVQQLRGF